MSFSSGIQHTGLPPIIKWAGGKEKELTFIFNNAPQHYDRYYEPFVGGGAVFAAIPARHHYINDKSIELIRFYRCLASCDSRFYEWMEAVIDTWQSMLGLTDLKRLLCEQYIDYRDNKLTDDEMKAVVHDLVELNNDKVSNVLSPKFVWHRDSYINHLRQCLTLKIARMKRIEKEKHTMPTSDVFDNIETALMSTIYVYFRELYNDHQLMQSDVALNTAMFVFVRNYAYSGMFRYNNKGEFNVPYGGIGYNHKSLRKKMDYYKSERFLHHLSTTSIFNQDFEEFLRANPPQANDFVFFDPPYDSEFSTYAQNEFTQDDQRRLANYLINECQGMWMLVIKNTPFIYSLYDNHNLTIKCFDKKYRVSFKNRNDKNAEHLIIMNY